MDALSLEDVFAAYQSHPEFLGDEIKNVNQKGAVDSTMAHIAARTGRIEHLRTLIASGADIDAIGDLGNTPLHDAAMSDQPAAVLLLLENGADPTVLNEFQQTALDVANLGCNVEVADLLKKFTDR